MKNRGHTKDFNRLPDANRYLDLGDRPLARNLIRLDDEVVHDGFLQNRGELIRKDGFVAQKVKDNLPQRDSSLLCADLEIDLIRNGIIAGMVVGEENFDVNLADLNETPAVKGENPVSLRGEVLSFNIDGNLSNLEDVLRKCPLVKRHGEL